MTVVSPTRHTPPSLISQGNASPVALIEACIREAHTRRASDIHIEPRPDDILIRLRIDGVLYEYGTLPKSLQSELITRIKVLGNLRTDEHQSAQDGRFRHESGSTFMDIRISITPTYYGENAVLRLLREDRGNDLTLESLGIAPHDRTRIETALVRPHGMILATGPTGSGKTTTLYTLIKMVNTKDVSIITIEDPIEYAIPGVTHIQVNPRTSLTFAHGLRSILRQDPNIIMVGEIRDGETASIAINTALTGHLLLSTLHTNDAPTTLPRLIDMGIDTYLLASTISLAIGQRLVRVLCPHCKQEVPTQELEYAHLVQRYSDSHALIPQRSYIPVGCEVCDFTGYQGRIGIYETLVMSQAIRDAILRRASSSAIRTIGEHEGMTPLYKDGLRKVSLGITSMTEILRTIHE